MLRNLSVAAIVAVTLAEPSPAQEIPRSFYVSSEDYAIGEPHFRAVPGVLVPDFSGLSMDTVTAFPEIKRDSGLLIAAPLHPPAPSDACKDALWSVLRGLVDTLAGHPQVATAPLLRWAADQCDDQPAEEPNR